MARNTEVASGFHIIKPSSYGGRLQLYVPRALAVAAGIDGSTFVGAFTAGKCLVIAQVNHVAGVAMAEELGKYFEKAIAEWEKNKP